MDGSSSHAYAAGDLDSQAPSEANYASHSHSTTTVPHTLPPHEDDRPSLARQKRKRTCAADQDALEAAYARDPKPDKTARLEIVRHVSLGEKEVQIWFQNRRQSSRRKSRPLLPHEIAQYQLARSEQSPQMYSASPAPGSAPSLDTEEKTDAPGWAQQAAEVPQMSTMPSSEIHPSSSAPKRTDLSAAAGQPMMALSMDPSLGSGGAAVLRPQMAFELSAAQAADANYRHVGYLSNRRSAPQLWMNQTEQDVRFEPTPVAAEPARRLKKASSYVRLSMSFDGNATVVTKDGSSPSPPRASQTLLPLVNDVAIPSPNLRATEQLTDSATPSSLKRIPSGRSRDSRAWEFWCDKDARVELEDKAEKDSNGSAADAIGLLRSASGRSILGPLPRKRNSLLSRHPSDIKRVKLDRQRPTLQRSNTSLGRLQGESVDFGSAAGGTRATLKHSESALPVFVPGNDSDKENWSPNRRKTLGSSHAHSASQPHSAKTALREDRNKGNGVAQRPGGRNNRKHAGGGELDGENADPEADAEVAAFMDGARKSSSTSVEDELDCVQGLLSLSQGNWR